MEIGFVGLGKMGANMVQRLFSKGHKIVGYDIDEKTAKSLSEELKGATFVRDIEGLVKTLSMPRVIWFMVPSGKPSEDTFNVLLSKLASGDILIDGGNSNYRDTIRRHHLAKGKNVHFVDVGTSGGIWGLKEGYSMMVGGEKDAVQTLYPIFEALAPSPDKGWAHVGPSGSGHFVKMVHNGIEYGIMQAYSEGFELMQAKENFNLDLHQIAQVWKYGSVIRSWLLDLASASLKENPDLEGIKPFVPDSGEGRWTVVEGIELGVPLPVITSALQNRFKSQQSSSFGDRLLAALRDQFGGHGIKKT